MLNEVQIMLNYHPEIADVNEESRRGSYSNITVKPDTRRRKFRQNYNLLT